MASRSIDGKLSMTELRPILASAFSLDKCQDGAQQSDYALFLLAMATEQDAHMVENIIGYTFKSKRNLLFQALTAAGAVEEEWEGNRKLAQFGTALTEFLFVYLGYEVQADRNHTTDFKCKQSNNKQRAAVAERTGIDRCIKYSDKPGAQSPSVLGKAINAIIGAVFLDCKGTIPIVLGVMQHLGVFTQSNQTIDPTMLPLHATSSVPDVTSLAKALLGGRIDRTSLPDSSEQIQSATAPSSIPSIESCNATEGARATCTSVAVHGQDQLDLPLHNGVHGEDMDLDPLIDYSSPSESRDLYPDLDNQDGSSEDLNIGRQVNHRSTMKRKTPRTRTAVRKKSLDSHSSQIWKDSLASQLLEEAGRCSKHGCPLPEETFFTPSTRAAARDLGEEKEDTLAKILLFIASPHSIAALQEVIHRSKTEEQLMPLQSGSRLSKAERVTLIQKLDQSMIHLQLLRRHHVLELFRESGGPETRSSGGFVMATPQNFDMAHNKPGNPSNSAKAKATAHMMAELFPGIRAESNEYKARYRMVTHLRKLGHRLHVLEKTFGKGILGLMLDRGITGQLDFGISDRMIMKLPDSVFKDFVTLLDKSQGKILRQFSAAVSPIVETLVVGPRQQHEPFRLETVQVSEILRLPKGSPELLSLLI